MYQSFASSIEHRYWFGNVSVRLELILVAVYTRIVCESHSTCVEMYFFIRHNVRSCRGEGNTSQYIHRIGNTFFQQIAETSRYLRPVFRIRVTFIRIRILSGSFKLHNIYVCFSKFWVTVRKLQFMIELRGFFLYSL